MRPTVINIYYDGNCPFCANYVSLVRFREAAGPVQLIDLRKDIVARDRLYAGGFDPDVGMAVETAGHVLHGAEAMTAISLMSSQSGLLNRLFASIFRSRAITKTLYPVLRAGRNATLFFMGRCRMRTSLPEELASFEIFARLFGLFSIAHAVHATFVYPRANALPVTITVFVAGCLLYLFPRAKQIFLILLSLLTIEGILRAPSLSNHSIINYFFLLTAILAGLWYWLRGAGWQEWFLAVRPVGRCLLLTMYVFGVFHKINRDFLNPEVSCAVALWQRMPSALNWIDNSAMHYLAIYGTFAVEGAIFVALLLPRLRHYGIVVGIGFHTLLAFSGYALYSPFSTLSTALHVLFVSPTNAHHITGHAAYRRFETHLQSPTGIALVLAAIGLFVVTASTRQFALASICWLILLAGPTLLIMTLGCAGAVDRREHGLLRSPLVGLNLVSLAFFLNCAMPYLGLKTSQTVNMFANIRVEGGISNHLVFSSPPGPFRYLDEVVTVQAETRAPQLHPYVGNAEQGIVYYEFLSMLEETPDAVVSYSINGQPSMTATATELLARDGALLHPKWVRKYFHFKPISLEQPVRCGRA